MKALVSVVLAAGCIGAGAAASSALPDISQSYLFSPAGKLTPLRAGVTYRATQFPLPLRVTPPDGRWAGAQWKQNRFPPDEIKLRHLTCSTNPAVCAPPYFGWVTFGNSPPTAPPQFIVLLLAGYSRTPSVAATVENLRTRGHGATYGPTAPVTLAGFAGVQFEGQIVGSRHVFVPFSPRTNKATGFPDAIEIDGVHPCRFDVLDVRGKTVVIFVGSLVLSPEQFASFLPRADQLLGRIRFPKGGAK